MPNIASFFRSQVDPEGDDWIHETAPTSEVARDVESYLLRTHGCKETPVAAAMTLAWSMRASSDPQTEQ